MQTLKGWFFNAIHHPLTTLMGAVAFMAQLVDYCQAHPGQSHLQLVLGLVVLVLGAAMKDPGK